jgi:hypothetical protein
MIDLLFVCLAAVATPLARGDYVLTREFPAAICSGISTPISVNNVGCISNMNSSTNVICARQGGREGFFHNLYDNKKCAGPPLYSTFIPNGCLASPIASLEGLCVSGDFDSTAEEASFSVDEYETGGTAGIDADTCPPSSIGAEFSSRKYLFQANVSASLCIPFTSFAGLPPYIKGQSARVTCSIGGSFSYEVFDKLQCSGPHTLFPAGCTAISSHKTSFNNAGSLCPPSSATTASTNISTVGLIGIGVGVGLGVAALAFAAHFAYKRAWLAHKTTENDTPLLDNAIGMVSIPDSATSIPS